MVRPCKWPLQAMGYAAGLIKQDGWKKVQKDIVKKYSCPPPSRTTLFRWAKEQSNAKLPSVFDGRPSLINPLIAARLLRAARSMRRPFTFTEFTLYARSIYSLDASDRTIRRWLASRSEWTCAKSRYRWALTKHQREARVAWCQQHKEIDWSKVVWADEKTWSKVSYCPTFFYCSINQPPPVDRTSTNRFKVNTWAYMTSTNAHVHQLSGALTWNEYKTVLTGQVPKRKTGAGWQFIQDNAPCHRNKAGVEGSKGTLRSLGYRLLPLPPYSPDLNPVENLWAIVGRRISRRRLYISSAAAMEEAVKAEFAELGNDTSLLTSLAHSMPKRIEQVLQRKGDMADW